ncbi:hypothetical protein DFA_00830 [Cavenderia fasciculata]|uniref:Uncharacterized protein n=1 Tax=Cavenderia fasciculata TaxID=261658 RepID=F4PU35_CACFS|nr:uncharacterized protein DFA_00830 [Cavenderia fasciculata]EGG20961.1 hypothetical protein DFA_00830 [Cavenderia fasciculata]|eukprot:XP_004358811.1 hypothetical protein DFA_00830 [Cavenderia fasciculata]
MRSTVNIKSYRQPLSPLLSSSYLFIYKSTIFNNTIKIVPLSSSSYNLKTIREINIEIDYKAAAATAVVVPNKIKILYSKIGKKRSPS